MATGSFKLPISSGGGTGWVRPSDWLPMPTVTAANDTFVGLYAVFSEGNNFAAFLFTTSAGQYQVDWGDGTVTLHNSNTKAEHEYNYATISSSTLTSRGYKQAIITVTAVSGLLLTANFQQQYTGQNQPYSTGFLDCIISMPNYSVSTFQFGGATVRHSYCERFDVKTLGSCNNVINMFQNCISLQSVPLFNTSGITNITSMFNGCSSLKNIPLFNFSNATTVRFLFLNCTSLQTVPALNLSATTDIRDIFSGCFSLKNVPAVTFRTTPSTATNIFTSCSSLSRCESIFNVTVSFLNCQLSRTALVEIFTNLFDRTATTSATITISGNWGATALTTGERAIATGKNWVIVG